MVRLIALGGVIYLFVGYSGKWITQHMQHQLEVISCQQAAHADHRSDDECRALSLKPIAFLGHE
jgi:hypothetical protein